MESWTNRVFEVVVPSDFVTKEVENRFIDLVYDLWPDAVVVARDERAE